MYICYGQRISYQLHRFDARVSSVSFLVTNEVIS